MAVVRKILVEGTRLRAMDIEALFGRSMAFMELDLMHGGGGRGLARSWPLFGTKLFLDNSSCLSSTRTRVEVCTQF